MHSDACRSASYHERFRRCAERAMALSHRHMPTLRAFGFLSAPLEAALADIREVLDTIAARRVMGRVVCELP